jgi:hypothetical protein
LQFINDLRLNAIVHKTRTPPHLFSDAFIVKKGFQYLIKLKSFREIFLPFPYQTNCSKYEIISDYENSPKSQEDCIVKYMQQKELEVCSCYRNWFYSDFKRFDLKNLRNNSCDLKLD